MSMRLYPAIDISDGKAVRLTKGHFDAKTIYDDDPLDAARSWVQQGARYLHVVDLDGAKEGRPQNLHHPLNLLLTLHVTPVHCLEVPSSQESGVLASAPYPFYKPVIGFFPPNTKLQRKADDAVFAFPYERPEIPLSPFEGNGHASRPHSFEGCAQKHPRSLDLC